MFVGTGFGELQLGDHGRRPLDDRSEQPSLRARELDHGAIGGDERRALPAQRRPLVRQDHRSPFELLGELEHHRPEPGPGGLGQLGHPVPPERPRCHGPDRAGEDRTVQRCDETIGVGRKLHRIVHGVGGREGHGVQFHACGLIEESNGRSRVGGHVPLVDGDVDHRCCGGVGQGASDDRFATVALDDDPETGQPGGDEVGDHFVVGLTRGRPRHVQAFGSCRVQRLRAPGQHPGRGEVLAQSSIETSALGRREPRAGPDAGGQHHDVDGCAQHGAGGLERGVEIAEQRRCHRRAVNDLGASPGQQLGLLVRATMPGDTHGEADERGVLGHRASRCQRRVTPTFPTTSPALSTGLSGSRDWRGSSSRGV